MCKAKDHTEMKGAINVKIRKLIAVLLTVALLASMTTYIASAAETSASETSAGSYYNGSYLESYAQSAYNETGLGATYSPASTTWKVWSPEATAVKLKLYNTGSDTESGAGTIGTYDLTKNSTTGVWSTTLTGDYKNVYYTYLVTAKGATNETQDVYSKAVGVNGNRSMVVDLDSTDPDGWSTDKHVLHDEQSDAAVWEVHVRDFSIADNSGVSAENKGKYLAFTEGGTKLNGGTTIDDGGATIEGKTPTISTSGTGDISTCVDYLVEQGINTVQLLPVYDFQSVDEISQSSRNWGYDPMNYNVPEGSYSTDPYNGNTRITEFKQMIQALHDRGISVIMDVVYNHTFVSEGSCFNKTVPGYYYRLLNATTYYNGSGCGNVTASDKLMFRKYMAESVAYWAEEYHIDGFRFDLMGCHDVTTMNTIRTKLDNLYSDGSGKKIIMYGEPWSGGTTGISDGATQAKASSLNARVGMFADGMRDAIKGSTDGSDGGWIQGGTTQTDKIWAGLTGSTFTTSYPSQVVTYADCHDNLCLWDKIVKSNGSTNYTAANSTFTSELRLAGTILFVSQGVVFTNAGTEFARTKFGDSNSYKSEDKINQLDWSNLKTFATETAYFKGLRQIREAYSPFTNGSSKYAVSNLNGCSSNVIAYSVSNSKSGEWNKVCVALNNSSSAKTVTLPSGSWVVVCNGTKAGLTSLGNASGSYSVPARSGVILVDSASFGNYNKTIAYGTLTTQHIDADTGKVLKTQNAKYKAGTTYRAVADKTLLFDYDLVRTEGSLTGTVVANQSVTAKLYYKATGVKSGYLTVNYLNASGASVKTATKYHLREGDSYAIPFSSVQGYQLDTSKYPANTYGTFDGNDKTINFYFKNLDSTTTTVHYYNSKGWGAIRCYAYTDSGEEPNGKWSNAKRMKNDGNSWYSITINVPSCYVMFHPASGSDQEPAQGENGYPVSGEAWIQNKTVTFSCKVVTSHINLLTGEKIADDVVDSQAKTTSSNSYKTSPIAYDGKIITPLNAAGNYTAGTTNVVYLYDNGVIPPTDPPILEEYILGDADGNETISINDATVVQKICAKVLTASAIQNYSCDVDGDGRISIVDATYIQKYLAKFNVSFEIGKKFSTEVKPTQPVTQPPTDPTPDPTEGPTTSTTNTVKFTDSNKWGTIYIYAWNDESGDPYEAWPGTPMTVLEEDNGYGQTTYTADIPSEYDRIIFTTSTGSPQSQDITWDGSYEGYWATSKTTVNGMGSTVYVIQPWGCDEDGNPVA